ncbi:MAG TPA: DNA polymerase III subunit chi [Gammaproteobacteria bacterium]|nr:DNA polymerase III subunit chi [Gammaproteobacteria bacterium]
MTRIDFYILESTAPDAGDVVACRLAEKAAGLGHRVYIHTGEAGRAQALDELLWTYRAGSFVPHALFNGETADQAPAPVLVGAGDGPAGHADVLINLAEDVPMFFSRFERVAEVISGDEAARKRGRERFRFYRERGYDLETHKLGS